MSEMFEPIPLSVEQWLHMLKASVKEPRKVKMLLGAAATLFGTLEELDMLNWCMTKQARDEVDALSEACMSYLQIERPGDLAILPEADPGEQANDPADGATGLDWVSAFLPVE